ncbi:hypothetical protein MPOCJGCO_4814 [Methylobacterium trifolii]|uniref:Uncharacterized protein n=2 Tax=Methylobacterium trifolii TaxID=1003092 RepID=A0ABQ4U5I1_9HYPH|nr:hypothetical protein MPOCJGCO_4814 [Methylobacterium trifolii]
MMLLRSTAFALLAACVCIPDRAPAAEQQAEYNSPLPTTGVVRYGMSDSSIGKLIFLSEGTVGGRILLSCKAGVLCEVWGTVRGEQIVRVAKAIPVKPFAGPRDPIVFVYSHYKEGSGAFWLEDDDLESLYTPRMAGLMVKSRRASEILESESAGAGPWIQSQEWIIRGVKVEADDRGAGKALATATYRNLALPNPKPETLAFDMVRTEGGWRIDDIQFPRQETARFGTSSRLSDMLRIEIAEGEKEMRDKVAKAASTGSLCRFGEGEIFTCSAGGKQYSICTSGQTHALPHQWIEYRAGTPAKPELVHRSEKVGAPGSFYGAFEPFATGEVSYVRFTKDGYDYTAYSDENSRPQTSGVIVRKEGRRVANIKCSGGKDDAMPKNAFKMPSNMILAVPYDTDQLN